MAILHGRDKGLVSDINVTPLVDVMLVLLIIFMVSASIETFQVQEQKRKVEETLENVERTQQQVPVNLPKTDAEPVNLAQERKLVMTINHDAEFYVGRTLLLRCLDLAPGLRQVLGPKGRKWQERDEKQFEKCLKVLWEKLSANEKLKADKEMYLRADRAIPYGMVLKVMARIRAAGVTKFGLVAEPEELDAPK